MTAGKPTAPLGRLTVTALPNATATVSVPTSDPDSVRTRERLAEHLSAVVDHCTRNAIAPTRWPDL